VTLGIAPLTHRALLSRIDCPSCHLETLHRGYKCLHCGHDHTPGRKPKKPAFGARLVLTPDWLKQKRKK
jgi:hypothetical protein